MFAKKVKEFEELKECTFRPQLKTRPEPSDDLVLVRGFGRFCELKDMHKTLEAQKQDRQVLIFNFPFRF